MNATTTISTRRAAGNGETTNDEMISQRHHPTRNSRIAREPSTRSPRMPRRPDVNRRSSVTPITDQVTADIVT